MTVYLLLTVTMDFTPFYRLATFAIMAVLSFVQTDFSNLFQFALLMGVLLADLSLILEHNTSKLSSASSENQKPGIFSGIWPILTIVLAFLFGSYTELYPERMAWSRTMTDISVTIFPRGE